MPAKQTKKEPLVSTQAIIESKQLASIQKVLITMAALLITIIGLRSIAVQLIAPILLAFFFAILLYPIFIWFRKRGYSSGVSVVLMLVTIFLGMSVIVAFFTWSFSLISDQLSMYVDAFKTNLAAIGAQINLDSTSTEAVISQINPQMVTSIISTLLSGLGNAFFYFVLIPILSLLLLLQVDSIPKHVMEDMFGAHSGLSKFKKFSSSVSLYVSGRVKVNLISGFMFAIALLILGVPYPFVWGSIGVILGFIPYIGMVVTCIPPALLSLAMGGLLAMFLTIGAMAGVNIFVENAVEPYVMGKTNKISIAAVVISLVFWTWMMGAIGAILSVPLTVLLKTILADYQETSWLAALMEGDYEDQTVQEKVKPGGFNVKGYFSKWMPGKQAEK